MLDLILYSQIPQFIGQTSKITVVVPGPAEADQARLLVREGHIEVVTISHFISSLISNFTQIQKVYRKSELLLMLAFFWKSQNVDPSFELFNQSYNLLTDLRSFSTNINLFENVFKSYDEKISDAVKLYWHFFEQQQIVDEHRAYAELSKIPIQLNSDIYFWGFKFLSGLQVDFIKSLSGLNDVRVYFSKNVYEKLRTSDWPTWFSDGNVIKEDNITEEGVCAARIVRYQPGELSSLLKKNNLDIKFQSLEKPIRQLQELLGDEVYFKLGIDLFGEMTGEFCKSLKDLLNNSSLGHLSIWEIESEILSRQAKALKESNFKLLKVISLYKTILNDFKAQSIKHDTVTRFDLEVFEVSLRLNLPRASLFPLIKKPVRHLDKMRLKKNEGLVLVGSTTGKFVSKSDLSYPTEVYSALAAIGPVKRNSMTFLVEQEELNLLAQNKNNLFLIEQGIEEKHLFWNEWLADKNVEKSDFHPKSNNQKTDYLSSLIGEFKKIEILSPSKIQTYIDCPRKFYFTHVQNLELKWSSTSEIKPDQLGNIEHEIIREYIEKNGTSLKDEIVKTLSKSKIDLFVSQKGLQLNKGDYEYYLSEVEEYSKNGILTISSLEERFGISKITFEEAVEIPDLQIRGRIDCYLEFNNGTVGILDFKRSAYGIPKIGEHEKHLAIQIWIYVLANSNKKLSAFGYVNLSSLDEDESLLFLAADDVSRVLNEEKIEAQMVEARKVLQNLVSNIKADNTFTASPKTSQVCRFCSVKNFCHKQGDDS